MRVNRNLVPVFLTGLLLLAACTPRPATPPPVPGPAPLSTDALRLELERRSEHWKSFQANLHIRAESPKGKFRLRTVVVASLPDQIRLEAFTLLGQTAGVLTLSGSQSNLWVPSEKVLYTADRPEALVEYFLGIPIPLSEFGYSLVAAIPPDRLSAALKITPTDSGWSLESDSPGGIRYTWEVLAQPLAIKNARVAQDPRNSYAISYSPAAGLAAEEVPHGIGLSSEQWQMEVAVDKIESARELNPSLFTLDVPKDVRRIRLGRIQ